MAIEEGYKANFHTLLRAAGDERLALVECLDIKTRQRVMVVSAISDRDGEFDIVPLAKMFDGNPYEELAPPNPEGGFGGRPTQRGRR